MKKTILVILIIFFIIIAMLFITLRNIQAEKRALNRENAEYEAYLNKKIYGTELATLINKIVDKNEKNNIAKDNNNYYIENDENSIILEVNMKTIEEIFRMEQFYNNNITKFVQNFNDIQFKCNKIEYNSKGKVSKIVFDEILVEE